MTFFKKNFNLFYFHGFCFHFVCELYFFTCNFSGLLQTNHKRIVRKLMFSFVFKKSVKIRFISPVRVLFNGSIKRCRVFIAMVLNYLWKTGNLLSKKSKTTASKPIIFLSLYIQFKEIPSKTLKNNKLC